MATKRKRTRESNKAVESATDAPKPEASGRIKPRKRTDAPMKVAKAKPSAAKLSVAKVAPGKAAAWTDPSGKSARVASSKPTGRTGSTPRVSEADEAGASSADNPRERRPRRGAEAKPRRKRWPFIVVGTLLAVVLLAVGGFSWDRWLRYDDAAEFQGSWQTHGTTAVVVIDGESIKLTEDVTWKYTLDTDAKTIAFAFGNMEGSGRYRFSLDRSQLIITDGDGYTWLSTLTDDIAWQFDQLMRAIQGQPQAEPPSADEATVLDRLSHDVSATPQTGAPFEPEPEPEPEAADESKAGSQSGASSDGVAEVSGAPGTETGQAGEGDGGSQSPGGTQGGDANGDAADSANAQNNGSATEGGGSGSSGSSGKPSDMFDVSDLPA